MVRHNIVWYKHSNLLNLACMEVSANEEESIDADDLAIHYKTVGSEECSPNKDDMRD